MSQAEKLALLEKLQGEDGAQMGKGLQMRQERAEELKEPAAQEELAETLQVLDIDRTTAVAQSVAVPMVDRTMWQPDGIQGLDVSSHQEDPETGTSVNWQDEWKHGARFVYVKTTEALSYKNPYFSKQHAGATGVGMVRGAYHFAIPNVSSGRAQANYMVDNGGGWSADGKTLPPLLDIEWNPYLELGNACYNMSPSQIVAWIKDFSATIKARTGRLPAIYTAASWWKDCTGSSTAFKGYPLHVANYPSPGYTLAKPALPAGWTDWEIWQYSPSGPYAGDSNVWHGTMAELRDFAANRTVTYNHSSLTASPGDMDRDGRPDLVTRLPDGNLWFYPGNGAGGYGAAVRIGGGWQVFNALVGAGTYDGDAYPDLLARHSDGALWFYAGTGKASFKAGVRVGASGWNVFADLIGAGDLNGDGRRDLLGRKADGTVYFYPGLGTGRTGTRVAAATGWQVYDSLAGVQDFNGDGAPDLVARKPDGSLWLLAGTGKPAAPGSLFGAPRRIGASGWQAFDRLLGVMDNNRDGKNDLLGIYPDGRLAFYAGTQMRDWSGMKPRVAVGGSGWAGFTLVLAPGDFNGDSKADLIGRKTDGTLWFAAGNGKGGHAAPVRIGRGWNIYTALVGVGDYNADGKNDLLARQSDGTLWFYAGTGSVTSSQEGYRARVKVGNSGWNQFSSLLGAGDVDGNGRQDLVALRPDGSAWLYSGQGNGRPGTRSQIGGGWNAYRQVVAAGDYDGDRRADLLGGKADGTLWMRSGTGSTAAGMFAAEKRIGSSGWQQYNRLLGPGDFNNDGKVDLLATKADGSMYFYAGTRFTNSGLAARAAAGRL
ncbi:lysozyme M1 [Arthrobacter crystallopoietes BAB-32]|uniref:lysozyme n=2 Tax=Crystallibacter crystallopoietes TaxID=37928 RepID=N1V2N7_9MICC|nr:lysozyme M1 [Arthrobacter crystallopoietes BAB-32]